MKERIHGKDEVLGSNPNRGSMIDNPKPPLGGFLLYWSYGTV